MVTVFWGSAVMYPVSVPLAWLFPLICVYSYHWQLLCRCALSDQHITLNSTYKVNFTVLLEFSLSTDISVGSRQMWPVPEMINCGVEQSLLSEEY